MSGWTLVKASKIRRSCPLPPLLMLNVNTLKPFLLEQSFDSRSWQKVRHHPKMVALKDIIPVSVSAIQQVRKVGLTLDVSGCAGGLRFGTHPFERHLLVAAQQSHAEDADYAQDYH